MMNTLQHIANASKRLGYRGEAIKHKYRFNDFAGEAACVREAAMAVFTQTPASYRSAAFGVAKGDASDAAEVVGRHRALGAPLFFVIENDDVSVWQVFGQGPARLLQRTALGDLDALFDAHRSVWAPDAIHRAKSIGKFDSTYQLDFVDSGLLPAIEGQIHHKLDRLLSQALQAIPRPKSAPLDDRRVFRGIFRLLAAKILLDRQHEASKWWNVDDVGSVLAGIGAYYNLHDDTKFAPAAAAKQMSGAWTLLRDGVSVANISADDLAYVYENTLVTPETRQAFGTHSTPRQVAEFISARLRLWDPSSSALSVYEPFSGAGVLLVAALRHLREALPTDWSDRKRHEHLVKQLRGSEIDSFACEVATLSLILADYPNTNGWKIDNADLFEGDRLKQELKAAQVILCNPPFEPLTQAEKKRYPEIAAVGGNKAEAVLKLAIQSNPLALGFVLPRALLHDRAYRWHRTEIERRYGDIELVSLPDKIFAESQVESALLIAREPRDQGIQRLRASEVEDRDRKQFLSLGVPSQTRQIERAMGTGDDGELWLTRLSALWHRLRPLATLGDSFEAHWGLRWLDKGQATAAFNRPAAGRSEGLMHATDHRQFLLGQTQWIDTRPDRLYGAGNLPWNQPKILCNAGRSGRGKWRISAAVDRSGLVASQQFVVLWSSQPSVDLDAIAAVINGPLANAYMSEHSHDRRLRINTLLSLPMPRSLPPQVGAMAREYTDKLTSTQNPFIDERGLQDLLNQIDALVLEAYDLPPKMARDLLSEFLGMRRPVAHAWEEWGVTLEDSAFSLSELRSAWLQCSRGNWPSRELPPVPASESRILQAVE